MNKSKVVFWLAGGFFVVVSLIVVVSISTTGTSPTKSEVRATDTNSIGPQHEPDFIVGPGQVEVKVIDRMAMADQQEQQILDLVQRYDEVRDDDQLRDEHRRLLEARLEQYSATVLPLALEAANTNGQ